MSPIAAVCLGVFAQDRLVALVLVTVDVAGMALGQQRVPLVGWQPPLRTATTVLTPE